MKIVDVYSKDVHVTLEFNHEEIVHMLNFLDGAIFTFDGDQEPEKKEAAEFAKKHFEMLRDLSEHMKGM